MRLGASKIIGRFQGKITSRTITSLKRPSTQLTVQPLKTQQAKRPVSTWEVVSSLLSNVPAIGLAGAAISYSYNQYRQHVQHDINSANSILNELKKFYPTVIEVILEIPAKLNNELLLAKKENRKPSFDQLIDADLRLRFSKLAETQHSIALSDSRYKSEKLDKALGIHANKFIQLMFSFNFDENTLREATSHYFMVHRLVQCYQRNLAWFVNHIGHQYFLTKGDFSELFKRQNTEIEELEKQREYILSLPVAEIYSNIALIFSGNFEELKNKVAHAKTPPAQINLSDSEQKSSPAPRPS